MDAEPRFFIREVTQSFKRNLMLNLTSIATVMVLIFQLGFFIILIANINHFTNIVLDKLLVTVVLSPDMPIDKIGQLKFRIIKHPDVKMVRFISKQQAFERLKKRMQSRIDLENLTTNPLPDTFEIELEKAETIKTVVEEIEKYPGIDEVRYGSTKLVDRLIKLSQRISLIGSVIIIMLTLSAVFLISSTIKLAVYSRRKEIAIMELVGASHLFIRGPFITEGLLHGIFGSSIAIVLLNILYYSMTHWIIEDMPFIPVLPSEFIAIKMSFFLLLAGILVGTLSSYISVNKYLKI